MSAAQRQEVWARLAEAALVEGEPPPAGIQGSPWFVRVMLGIAGWIGAIFLLGFAGLMLSSLFESASLSLLAGAIVCATAAFLFRVKGDNDFLAQFGFALSLAGQGLLLVGLNLLFEYEVTAVAFAAAVVQAVLFFLAPSFLHRVWTAGTGAVALAVALDGWHLSLLAPALLTAAFTWVWLRELDHPRQNDLWRAGGYGLTLAAVVTVVFPWEQEVIFAGLGLVSAALSGAALLYAVLSLLKGVPLTAGPARAALTGAVLVALASLAAPGLAPAVAILVLGYANGNRVLTGLGILVLLGYLSHYYYSLEMTLLAKSALLAGAGCALLLARLALHRLWPAAGEDADA